MSFDQSGDSVSVVFSDVPTYTDVPSVATPLGPQMPAPIVFGCQLFTAAAVGVASGTPTTHA